MKSVAFVVAMLAAACGSKSPSQPTTPPASGGEEAAAGSATAAAPAPLPDFKTFDELSHEQRGQFMKEVVMPAMAPLFKEHDAQKFAEFGCKTCHGPGVENHEFHMPNDALPKLGKSEMSKFKPADLEWMSKVIKPKMAELLKEAEWTPENPNGFGCMECHTEAK